MDEFVRPAVIFFADLVGSTRLYQELGDQAGRALVSAAIDAMSDEVRRRAGQVVEIVGDQVMASFEDAEAAAGVALSVLDRLEGLPGSQGRLSAYVGFHRGPVSFEGTRPYGDTVNAAARILALAKPGEILLSGETAERLPAPWRSVLRPLDRRVLRGRRDETEVVQLLRSTSNLTVSIPVASSEQARQRLRLRLAEQELELAEEGAALRLGRHPQNDLVWSDPRISGRHAIIQLRGGKFVLSDESTNGTRVISEGGRPLLLRREETVLVGSGTLSAGGADSASGAEPQAGELGVVAYSVYTPGGSAD